jgi:hypothetical protein
VEQLQTEYAVDPAASDRKYKRSTLEIQGRVRGISKDTSKGILGAAFTENNSHRLIIAYLSASASADAAALVQGQDLVLRCRVEGVVGGTIEMKNCSVVR